MAQVETTDEQGGWAEQLELPIAHPLPYDHRALKAECLRTELDLVTPAEVALALGIAEQTLATWRSDRTGPDYVKLGKQVFYTRTDLSSWIAQNGHSPCPPTAFTETPQQKYDRLLREGGVDQPLDPRVRG